MRGGLGGGPTPVERGSPEWWARLDAHTADIRDRIAELGFVVQSVIGTRPGQIHFAYTIGLTEQGRPELVCLGPTAEGCALLVDDVAHQDTSGDEVTRVGSDGVSSFTLQLRPVVADDSAYPLGMATRIYGHGRVTAKQILWPNDHGAYPGEPGWDDAPHGAQPLLPAASPS